MAYKRKKTICLCMIVKNESKIIRRCLAPLKSQIDYWIIVDTGSIDGTQDIIKEEMKGIKGELIERPWVNFGHNRNEALEFCRGKSDYILVCDADEEYVFLDKFNKRDLEKDSYHIRFDHDVEYVCEYLLKNGLDWHYVGVTHEVINSEQRKTTEIINTIQIKDHMDGGSKADKFKRDIELLTQGLKDEPDNTRYMFYLAQSYRDIKDYENAFIWYEKRANSGGWEQEVFYSIMQSGLAALNLNQDEKAVYLLLDSFQCRSSRAEPLYYLALHYRAKKKYQLAYRFSLLGESIPHPDNDILFIHRWVYTYGLKFEKSIAAYYIGKFQESLLLCNEILKMENLPEDIRSATIRNREFSVEKLKEEKK